MAGGLKRLVISETLICMQHQNFRIQFLQMESMQVGEILEKKKEATLNELGILQNRHIHFTLPNHHAIKKINIHLG